MKGERGWLPCVLHAGVSENRGASVHFPDGEVRVILSFWVGVSHSLEEHGFVLKHPVTQAIPIRQAVINFWFGDHIIKSE